MAAILSILDPSPVFQGRSAGAALNETRALAQAADDMSYRAYWVQEHHNAASFAGSVPEVLMADLAARTSRIVLGSGGIMLPNYSPLKVAEVAATLSALNPGRIEIGLGRATGADPRASAALLGPGGEAFPQMLRLLLDWLQDSAGLKPLGEDHRARGIAANPKASMPDIWMLCSSPASASFAGAMGLKLAFADFLAPGGARTALQAYQDAFQPSPILSEPYCGIGLVALAAETDAEAERLAATLRAWSAGRVTGKFSPFLEVEPAKAELARLGELPQNSAIIGRAEAVVSALNQAAEDARADELFILSVAETTEARLTSYRLIDQAWTGLA